MRVKELMTHSVATCRSSDTLNEAAKIMWEADCGCVPVIDDDRQPVGMITDRDICMATYTQGKPPSAIRLPSAMSSTVITCRADDSLAVAEETMRRHRLRRLPVVDTSGAVVGILSLTDLATRSRVKPERVQDELGADAIVSTLAAICTRGAERAAVAQ